MEILFNYIEKDLLLIIITILNIILLILYIVNVLKLKKIRKDYKNFMNKLGNGTNIEEVMRKYIDKTNKVDEKNNEINNRCCIIEKELKKCIQKVGIVRYSAFKDTGSDLSFALALLDQNNDGIVLNGIYSREMSNIYAKPIKNGDSKYTISEEEKEAITNATDL